MNERILFEPKFKFGQHPCKIEIRHNGVVDLMPLFEFWLINTEDWTSESFCYYVRSLKIPGMIIVTKDMLINGIK